MLSKKRHFKKGDYSEGNFIPIILVILFFVITGFLIVSDYKINKKRTELQAQIESLQGHLKTLEEEKTKLQAGISAIDNESFLEKEAREELGLKKPGEEVAVVVPPKEESAPSTTTEKNLWGKILQLLHLRD